MKERKLTEEEKRKMRIVSLAFEIQDEEYDGDEELDPGVLLEKYYELAKEIIEECALDTK